MNEYKKLFDASSVIAALKLSKPDILIDNYIQWLTVYESLNAIWKEFRLLNIMDPRMMYELIDVFLEIIKLMKILSPSSYEKEIVELAVNSDLTVYDASYIILAMKNNLLLVTEDKKLKRKATKYVHVLSITDLFK